MGKKTGRIGAKKISALYIAMSIMIAASVIIAIYEASVIIKSKEADRNAVLEYEQLQNYAVMEDTTGWEPITPEKEPASEDTADESEEEREIPRTYPQINVDHEALKDINPDYVGWLYIPAVELSYPVVKETFADQYLYTTFDGIQNNAGCLFMDDVSNSDFDGLYDFIFGHNMRNGTMFGSLRQLHEEGNEHLWEDEPYLYIYRDDKIMRYYIYSYYKTITGSPAYDEIYDHDAYDRLLKYTLENSMIEKPDMKLFEDYPEILSLSTCSGRAGGSQRFIVHCVKDAVWYN